MQANIFTDLQILPVLVHGQAHRQAYGHNCRVLKYFTVVAMSLSPLTTLIGGTSTPARNSRAAKACLAVLSIVRYEKSRKCAAFWGYFKLAKTLSSKTSPFLFRYLVLLR